MRNTAKLYLGLVLSGLLITGCSGSSDAVYSYGSERMESLIAQVPVERGQAEPFAADLCVVMGSEPGPDTSVGAEAAGLFSLEDGQVLMQRNLFQRMNPASTTKIMTALVALREADLSESVTVGEETVITEPGASLCYIKPGETLTMEQLLYGLMLPSGNDAGAAIAVHMAGSIEAFSDKMNDLAHEIGATDTHFVNPHGLTDENHYPTAYDLYLMYQEAMKYPEFETIVGTVSYTAN